VGSDGAGFPERRVRGEQPWPPQAGSGLSGRRSRPPEAARVRDRRRTRRATVAVAVRLFGLAAPLGAAVVIGRSVRMHLLRPVGMVRLLQYQ
jgi:hypothetical protein